jgi:tRNA dimethylallyltransferase
VIINADSQQAFVDLPILTARPTSREMEIVPHKLYGFLPADDQFSAGKWLKMARMEIDWALSQGQTPFIVGGTGMYISALLSGIAEIPEIDASVRAQVTSDYEVMGKAAFSERLRAVDPQFFERLAVYDRQRLLRAFEVWMGTGKSLSWWQAQEVKAPYGPDRFTLDILMPFREELYARCDARFLTMIEQGAVEEVKSLMPIEGALLKIIGARGIIEYLEGRWSLEETVTKAQQMTRNYAKRQMTWFRNQLGA